ncbi:Protein of unknown function (DUF3043) [Frankia sp. EI5c]|uniref:DUF3043 domain-containing protein n=1 Tax=Frankia sp. EI5c TaxID=683316 RepID=UPI0007C39692|nr:DUF3043 domain-containing protein [Frankia sp. EI5c]OAA28312.1 Protein of unknown function (DUF3043) [Frankia sp. EI5c]
MALLKKRNTEAGTDQPGGEEPSAGGSVRPTAGSPASARATTGKGRPTPTRAQARAARPRGSAGSARTATNSKDARRLARAERREQTQRYRAAMTSGNVKDLPPREQAPERVLARDFVDTRINIGPVFLGAAVVYFVGGLVPNSYVRTAASVLMLFGIIAVVVDSIVLGRQVSRKVAEKYPDSRVRVRAYAAQRALLPRRWRMPRPRVSRTDR